MTSTRRMRGERARAGAGSPAPRRCRAGSRRAPSAPARAARAPASASACTTSSRSARSGRCASTVAGKRGGEHRRRSPPRRRARRAGSSASVSEPRPGPTSTTTSSARELGRAHDAPHGVAVDDEVLAALLRRPYAEPLGQEPDLRRRRAGRRPRAARSCLLRDGARSRAEIVHRSDVRPDGGARVRGLTGTGRRMRDPPDHGATARCRRTMKRSRREPSGSASPATTSQAAACAASRSASGTRSQITRAPADQVQSSHCCTSR